MDEAECAIIGGKKGILVQELAEFMNVAVNSLPISTHGSVDSISVSIQGVMNLPYVALCSMYDEDFPHPTQSHHDTQRHR